MISKPLNAIILVRRGHVLQVPLIYTSLTSILNIIRSTRLEAHHNHIYDICIHEELVKKDIKLRLKEIVEVHKEDIIKKSSFKSLQQSIISITKSSLKSGSN
jgi:hypothetical protein